MIGAAVLIVAVVVAVIVFFVKGGASNVDGTVNREEPQSPYEMSLDDPPSDYTNMLDGKALGSIDPLQPYFFTIASDTDCGVWQNEEDSSSYIDAPEEFCTEATLNDGIAYAETEAGTWKMWDIDSDDVSDVTDPNAMDIAQVLPISRGHTVLIGNDGEIAAVKDGQDVWRHTAEDFTTPLDAANLALSADGRWVVTTEIGPDPVAIDVEHGTILPPEDEEFAGALFMPLKDGILLLPDGAFAEVFDVVAFDQDGKHLSDIDQLAHGLPLLDYAPYELQYTVESLTEGGPGDSVVDSREIALLPDGQYRQLSATGDVPSFEGVSKPCMQMPVLAKQNTMAICVVDDMFSAFEIGEDDATSDPATPLLWGLSGDGSDIIFHPFNANAWMIENGEHLFILK
ncbi:MAG: hypothetical protein Q4Q03_05640 [Bowdeniella nasicola]|nr:hypothetical protein [Bowdeniella nasicola]